MLNFVKMGFRQITKSNSKYCFHISFWRLDISNIFQNHEYIWSYQAIKLIITNKNIGIML